MNKLFINKTIEISSSAEKVWEVITEPRYTDQWTGEFMEGMRLESDWKMGSPALWKDSDDKLVVEGNVTKIEPKKFLRFTVFDIEMGRHVVDEDDGITFKLKESNNKTILHVLHGDFSILPEAQKYYDMTIEAWDRILPRVKELSEK